MYSFQILDLLGAAGTLDAHRAALEFGKGSTTPMERYLWALAQTPEPNEEVLNGENIVGRDISVNIYLIKYCLYRPL